MQPLPTSLGLPGTKSVTEQSAPRALALAYSVLVLVAVGRLGELIPGLGTVPLAKLAVALAFIVVFAKWKELPRLTVTTKPLARTALLLAAVAVLTAPFSIWRGASVGFLYQQLPVLVAVTLLGYKVSVGWSQFRKIARVLTSAAVLLAASALVGFHGGRAASSVTYDTNDLAYLLVTMAPLVLAFVLTAKTRMSRIVNVGMLGVVVVALLLTSSRGGFLGLLAVLVVLVFLPINRPQPRLQGGRRKQRLIPALLGIFLVAVVVWPNLPLETRTRLATVLSLKNDYNMDTANEHSRSSIWQRNFFAVLKRPIGYGVDSFEMVDMSTGGRFMAPHNAYLQVLVELGFLGLFLFIRIYAIAWRMLRSVRRTLLNAPSDTQNDEALVFARMLQVSLVGNAVAAFFLSMAYSNVLWTLLGVVIGCTSLVIQDRVDIPPGPNSTELATLHSSGLG